MMIATAIYVSYLKIMLAFHGEYYRLISVIMYIVLRLYSMCCNCNVMKHLSQMTAANSSRPLGIVILLCTRLWVWLCSLVSAEKFPMLAAVNWLFTLLFVEKSAWLNWFRGFRLSLQHADEDIFFALKI
ncbi:unnamed protein product [Sphagnum jensenii]|uniref:Uncharacterized protein n=1 Tax=Sphagnum jensenii TaxID=128206 RepID=A0ABP1ATR9_9BRYO